jgi:hypothetical protein
MELTVIHDCNEIHDKITIITNMHLKEVKHIMILIFEMIVTPPTMCIPSTNLPSLDHATHHTQQWVTLELGPSSIQGKGFLD